MILRMYHSNNMFETEFNNHNRILDVSYMSKDILYGSVTLQSNVFYHSNMDIHNGIIEVLCKCHGMYGIVLIYY